MAKIKKIDPKAVAKTLVMSEVSKDLVEAGFEVISGEDYGMTKGTLIIRLENVDVQLKPIAPKAGIDRYELAE